LAAAVVKHANALIATPRVYLDSLNMIVLSLSKPTGIQS
jgi:hypothetical protein